MDDKINCRAYGRRMSPGDCLANQVSRYCLPGWPCETCTEVGRPDRDPGANQGSFPDPGGAPSLKSPKTENRKPKTRPRLPAWLRHATPAVRRAYRQGAG